MYLLFAKLYARVIFLMLKNFHVNLPGLGLICRRIKREHIINVQGRKYYFYPRAASMYSLLITGKFVEPETHLFFSKVIPKITSRIGFIDVGAAVGEMVIDVAAYNNVDHVIGFEPDPDLAKACRLSAAINGYNKVNIISKVVADQVRMVNFKFNRGKGTSGMISEKETCTTEKIVCSTLDNEISENNCIAYIVLIDVEGAEPLVLKGGSKFINQKLPLIIFEYNDISRKHWNLSEIMDILGEKYDIYRLRQDGCLDSSFDKTWNCVAVHKDSVFYPVCQSITFEQT